MLISISVVGSKKTCTPTITESWGSLFDRKIITTGNTHSKYELVVGVCNNFLELVSNLYLTTGFPTRTFEKTNNLLNFFEVHNFKEEKEPLSGISEIIEKKSLDYLIENSE